MDDLEQNSKDLSQSNSSILREMLEVRGTTSNRNLDDGVVGGIAQTKMVEVDEMTLKADNQKRYRASGEARPIGGMSKANCRERTADLFAASEALSQLSYSPTI